NGGVGGTLASASLTAGTDLSQSGTITASGTATLVSKGGTLGQTGLIDGKGGASVGLNAGRTLIQSGAIKDATATSLTAGQDLTQTGTITSATIVGIATAGDVQAMGTTNGGVVTFTAPNGTAVIGGTLHNLAQSSLNPNNSIKPAFPNLDTSTAGLLVSGQTVHVLASTLVPDGASDIVFAILGRGNLAFDGLN